MGRDQVVEVHTGGVEWLHKHLDQWPGYSGHLQAKRLRYGRITLAICVWAVEEELEELEELGEELEKEQ